MTRHFLISGQVQGVGFRLYTRSLAEGLDLRGWVRNLKDGRVEVLAQGSNKDVDEFLTLLRQGPLGTGIKDVKTQTLEEVREHFDFVIREDGEQEWSEVSS